MASSPMSGGRVPQDWQQEINRIATAFRRKEAEAIREALAQYLGEATPSKIKGVIIFLEDRVANLKRKLASLKRLVRE